jgi:hypothetical protein
MRYVVDTNVFNRLVEGRIALSELPHRAELIATRVQIDEINRTPRAERRAQLLSVFATVAPEIVPTETGFWGGGFKTGGDSKWSTGQRWQSILSSLDAKYGKPNIEKMRLSQRSLWQMAMD